MCPHPQEMPSFNCWFCPQCFRFLCHYLLHFRSFLPFNSLPDRENELYPDPNSLSRRTQGRKFRKKSEAGTLEGYLFTDFLHDLIILSFYITQHYLPTGSITQNGLGLPTIIVNLENAPPAPIQAAYRPVLRKHFLNWVSLFPDDFSYIKLTKH